jgi:thioredoxin-dependent peroxiredoxin
VIRAFDAVIYAASVDLPEANADFARSLGLGFPILSDPGKQVAGAYGVITAERALPYRWTYYIGIDGTILAIEKKVNPATAGADVAAMLTKLGVTKK